MRRVNYRTGELPIDVITSTDYLLTSTTALQQKTMGLKLPKSLLRGLFPSKKKKNRRKKAAAQLAAAATTDKKYYEPQRDDGSPEVRAHTSLEGKGLQLVIEAAGGEERSGTPKTVTSCGSGSHVSLEEEATLPEPTGAEGRSEPPTPKPDQVEIQTAEPEGGDETPSPAPAGMPEEEEAASNKAEAGAAAATPETVAPQVGANDGHEAKSDEREAIQSDEVDAPTSREASDRVTSPSRRTDVDNDSVSHVSSTYFSCSVQPARITNEWESRRVPRVEEIEQLVLAEALKEESDASVNGAAVDILRGCGDPLDTIVEIEPPRCAMGEGMPAEMAARADSPCASYNDEDTTDDGKAGPGEEGVNGGNSGAIDEDKENCQASGAFVQ